MRDKDFKYDEKYFIDKFEINLCIQTLKAGYEIIMYYGSVLNQRLGEESGHNHPNNSPFRKYYLYRNRFNFNHKFPKRVILNILQIVKHLLLILLY